MSSIKAVSVGRFRADACEQRKRGLKVGGTCTEFAVTDGTTERYIRAYGATPGERKTAAIEAYKRGEGKPANESVYSGGFTHCR